jgi:hypothetical protein
MERVTQKVLNVVSQNGDLFFHGAPYAGKRRETKLRDFLGSSGGSYD